MFPFILQRASTVPMLPELRAALEQVVEQDWQRDPFAIQDEAGLMSVLESIFQHLSGNDACYARPFLLGWYTLRATILRLDHLQDDDPADSHSFDATLPKSQQYNLVLACYVLGMSMLDELDEQHIPVARIRPVMRLWNDNLLLAASGQHRDFTNTWPNTSASAVLEYYEETMRAKAGSIYVIGFGGIAMLASDDQYVIEALCRVGELYGTLLQLSDDIHDASSQAAPALTLAQVYNTALGASDVSLPSHTVHHYGQYVYRAYIKQMRDVVAILPQDLQQMLVDLFRFTFPLLRGNSLHD